MSYNFIEVGNTRKAVGFDGAIRLEIQEQYVDDLLKAQAVFIETGFEIIPYFPKSIKNEGELIARFDDVLNREDATALAGKSVYLREEEIQNNDLSVASFEDETIIGCMLVDDTIGEIGKILAIESFPQQEMLIVEYQEKEVMVPLHIDLIIEFREGEILLMDLPDGLLDIQE